MTSDDVRFLKLSDFAVRASSKVPVFGVCETAAPYHAQFVPLSDHGWSRPSGKSARVSQLVELVLASVEAADESDVDVLAQEVRDLRIELQQSKREHRVEVEALKAEVASLRKLLPSHPEDTTGEDDPALRWMEQNQESVAKHRGKRIAVHPERGIVAVGASYLEVSETVRELGLADQVLIASVPDF